MHISVVLGTRPELIKCAPVIQEARKRGHKVTVVSTGQHREMLTPLFDFFDVHPDVDLDVMSVNQTLTSLSSRVLERLDQSQSKIKSDCILVQGDTTSAAMAGYWAFCHRLPIAHIEAGLRTYDLSAPFPEEANRQILGRIATIHFAPTSEAVKALHKEQVPKKSVHLVGNTSIDALLYTVGRLDRNEVESRHRLPGVVSQFAGGAPLALVTAHRRESFGEGFQGICKGIQQALKANASLRVVYPVHPNPNVRKPVEAALGQHDRILLCDPLPYVGFIELMKRADLLLTDSGGVQEEGPSLRKPILVMREETERPEGVKAGFAKLVGTDPQKIQLGVSKALKKGTGGKGKNPYGDGKAAARIIAVLKREL